MDITVLTEDLETLTSRRMLLDLIEMDKDFFKGRKEKVEALRACIAIVLVRVILISPH